jgi:acetyl esterase/lipase
MSANYQLSPTPAVGFPEHLIDVKRIIAWARTGGPAYGVDPTVIVLAGSSAGAHLTAMAALTAGDPRFQPGFETTDTSVAAGVGLYGYYGPLGSDEHLASTPFAYVRPAAPPFLVVHGGNDTYTAAEDAHRFAMRLRAVSSSPVVYAELPGAQHSFDLIHSIRFEYVVNGIETFATWVTTKRMAAPVLGSSNRVDGQPTRRDHAWPSRAASSDRTGGAYPDHGDRSRHREVDGR